MYGTGMSYSMRLFSQYYLKNAFTVHNFSKKNQQNMLETSLTAKIIVSIIFSIKDIVFL